MARSFLLRQLSYNLTENLLFRPAVVAGAAVAAALLVPAWEATWGAEFSAAVARAVPMEPGSAQVVLGTLAGAMMTVVSVVYSILLVALSLASIQFSTRILASFMRDRAAQNTLGLLVGAFVYAILVLRSVRTDPPWVPVVAVYGAVGLALFALAGLVWFIHYIVRGIQANHLVDRIATEAEPVIDAVFGPPLAAGQEPSRRPEAAPPADAVPIPARRSGYIQLVAVDRLLVLARGGHLVLARSMGQFVVEGAPLAWWKGPGVLDATQLDAALDIGQSRTMQDDAEWGVRQIVDIGLKAISPAVNDPTTGTTCIDHIARLCVRATRLESPNIHFTAPDTVVEVGATSFEELIDLGFSQLRQYGKADMAISLRILRALTDIGEATQHTSGRAALLRQGRLTWEGARPHFHPADNEVLDARWERLCAVVSPRASGGQ